MGGSRRIAVSQLEGEGIRDLIALLGNVEQGGGMDAT
jgi:hypothetical protein